MSEPSGTACVEEDGDGSAGGVLLRADVRQQAPGEDWVRVVVWPVDDPVTEFSYEVPSPPLAPGEEPATRRPPTPGQMMRPASPQAPTAAPSPTRKKATTP